MLCVQLVEQISFQLLANVKAKAKLFAEWLVDCSRWRPATASAVVVLGSDIVPAVFSPSQDRDWDINLPEEIMTFSCLFETRPRLSQIFARLRQRQNFQTVWRLQAWDRHSNIYVMMALHAL